MTWFIYAPLQILCMLFCYITNWLVVLFADEEGNLPGFLRYWQTWDDSLDVGWYVKESVPKILRYDFDKHYVSTRIMPIELSRVGHDRRCVCLILPFTLKERIQRYFCRVMWLYRNCGYGFAFWIFGRRVSNNNMVMLVDKKDANGNFIRIGYDKSKGILTRPWKIHMEWPIYGRLRHKHYLGWKINHKSDGGDKLAMIANRIAFRIGD